MHAKIFPLLGLFNLVMSLTKVILPSFQCSLRPIHTHSMPCPCRAHAFPLPYRAAKRLEWCFHLIYAVRTCLIHTCHAMPMPCSDHAVLLKATAQHSTAVSRRPCCAVALRRTAWAWHGMASVNQTRSHCENQMGKTILNA